jgi:hypothetical protein
MEGKVFLKSLSLKNLLSFGAVCMADAHSREGVLV